MTKLNLSLISSLLLVSCADDNHDLHQYIVQVKQKKSSFIEHVYPLNPSTEFKFSESSKRRNPFQPVNHKKMAYLNSPGKHRIKQSLETYPLDVLKFVGTLTQENQTWGLIRQPDSQIVQVRSGDYIGNNGGRILRITTNSLQLREPGKKRSGVKHTPIVNLYIGK